MSRRSAPDSPWQNGVPPFALCQPTFNPMMNCSPLWGQSNAPFMAGNMMTPNMMRYGDSTSSHSNFRRNFNQQQDRRFQQRRRQQQHHTEGNQRGTKRSRQSTPRNGKRPAPRRSRSPPAKRAAKEAAKAEEEKASKEKEVDDEGENQQEDQPREEEELYDPAEPTNDAAEEAPDVKTDDSIEAQLEAEAAIDKAEDAEQLPEVAEEAAMIEQEDAQDSSALETEVPESSIVEEAANDYVEGEEKAEKHSGVHSAEEQCKSPEKQQTSGKTVQADKDERVAKKTAAEEKSQQTSSKSPKKPPEPAKKSDDKKTDYKRDSSSALSSKKQKGKGWCTVCELNFDGSFLEHRRTDEHKRKRDLKYPKCHPCSMGFNNTKQYELHCSGNFHKKNVEVQDNEIDEKSSPQGSEYLEEITAFFCTLCHVLLKPEVKDQHCRTRGHYRRHRDAKRKEEASRPKAAAEEDLKEKGDDDDAIFTITDEIVSDDEAKGDTTDKSQPAAEGVTGELQEPAKPDEQSITVATGSSDADATVDSAVPTEEPQVEAMTEDCHADTNTNGDTSIDTSAVQGGDEEMSGYKTADESTPEKATAIKSSRTGNTTPASTPKSSETPSRGRARGQIGRGRAIRGRRR